MAAYAALVSAMQTIEEIEHHPRPPISLDKAQLESLSEKITYLQEFLEGYSVLVGYSKDADPLEMRIADAAYAVEDVIESHIVEKIDLQNLSQSTSILLSNSITTSWEEMIDSSIDSSIPPQSTTRDEKFSFFNFCKCFRVPKKAASENGVEANHSHKNEANPSPTNHEDEASPPDKDRVSPTEQFYQSLQKVIEDMDSLKKEVMEIEEKTGVPDPLLRSTMAAASLRPSSGQNSTMVGFDDELLEIMDKLTGGRSDRQIIPIVGMGGAGKTTIARNIYQHQVVVQHFDFRAWVTISQEYGFKEIFLELLQEGGRDPSQVNEHQLGDQLHKTLFGRRYLIIIDDIWEIEVLDQLGRFFPDNNNGSRIVITSRISDFELTGSYVLKMGFLDKDMSWSLFSRIVFGEEICPLDLKGIGKRIVNNCRGLPLSIVVVGGLLAKSNHTREHWEFIEKNLNSTVNLEDDERCLKILHMSYNQLPIYLKPCFLYMGIFSEDKEISVSELIKLWTSEGLLKPISGKSLEEAANEYLQELINRNLVLAHKLGSIGNVKYCKIHDLLRDLCLRQAEKERFYNVIRQRSRHIPLDTSMQRRVVIPEHTSQDDACMSLQDMSPARSLMWDSKEVPLLRNFRLLRIMVCPLWKLHAFPEDVSKIVNIRCVVSKDSLMIFSSIHSFWNLQTLVLHTFSNAGTPIEIWCMPQLRHLKSCSMFQLADLPTGQNGIVLGNLRTLGLVSNFKCSGEVVKRIPNIKKLRVQYIWGGDKAFPDYYVHNFTHLHKLESFFCDQFGLGGVDHLQNLTFPKSLKKLTLSDFHWEDMLEKVGSLPHLEKFKLWFGYFTWGKWETVDGQFQSLKFLEIFYPTYLKCWKTESSHFPRLEHLVLQNLEELEEIPSEIGEIPTLKSIELQDCRSHLVISAKKILGEQEELYGEVTLQVLVNGKGLAAYQVRTRSPNNQTSSS